MESGYEWRQRERASRANQIDGTHQTRCPGRNPSTSITTVFTVTATRLNMQMQRHSFTALNSTFVVDSEYQFVKELGQGAYGCVVAAKHRRTGDGCAIKKITNINTKVRSVLFVPLMALELRTDGRCAHLSEDLDEAMSA
jgi:serine/threonine protein kinase